MESITAPFADLERRDWRTVSETDEPVRLALVGLGWFTREAVVPSVEDCDLATVSTLVSGSKDKAERVREAADGDRALTYEEFHDGVDADAYDAVYVCTPNALHLSPVETAAELGKAVICEKPMAATLEGAERIVETCEAAGVALMIAYRVQTNPLVRRLREAIREGVVGDPVSVDGAMTQNVFEAIAPDPDQWRLNPDLSGGAALNDLGIYPLNTARFLLDAEPTAARGTTRSEGEAFDGVDEHVTFEVEFDDGVLGSFHASQHAATQGKLAITGTEGRAVLEPIFFGTGRLRLETPAGEVTVEPDPSTAPAELTEEFDYFADRVLSGEPIHPDGRHGLTDMRVIDAVYRSAETGRRVSI